MRNCLREPIKEIFEAAVLLGEAMEASRAGNRALAIKCIESANMPMVRDWTESIWGKQTPYVRPANVENLPPLVISEGRVVARMPDISQQRILLDRDGYCCRYCGIPLIRKEVRERVRLLFPEIGIWGRTNVSQHAAFQAMWLQFDHVMPHSRGGTNELENIVVGCAPCNFGKMNFCLEELELADPRLRPPQKQKWSGLEGFK